MSTPTESLAKKPATKPAHPFFVEATHLFEEMEKLYKSVADRAYELFHHRGRQPGLELDDWFKAESELIRITPLEITEGDGVLIAKLEVPGFAAEDLKVSVMPDRLLISGKAEKKEEKKEADQVIYSDYRSNQIFREMILPKEVDPTKATASLKDGILQLTLPKVPEPAKVEVKPES